MLPPSAYFHVPVRLRLTHEETEIMLGLISRFMLAGWHAQLSREEMIWMSVDGQRVASLYLCTETSAQYHHLHRQRPQSGPLALADWQWQWLPAAAVCPCLRLVRSWQARQWLLRHSTGSDTCCCVAKLALDLRSPK